MNGCERFPIHVVSAVRNEEEHLPGLVDSMLSQTAKADRWTIVDDGSTDSTPSIIEVLEQQYDWIDSIRVSDRGYDDRGVGNSSAIKLGFQHALGATEVQASGIFDADITFDEVTIERIHDAFLSNPNLGIYGGEIVEFRDGAWKPPAILPEDFVRGACKIYHRLSYQDIGGILTRRGWDSIDNIKAAMNGWNVRRDTAFLVKHHRTVGSRDGFAVDQYKAGRDAYYIGGDSMLVIVRGLRRMVRIKPYFVGGLIFLSAYFGNKFLAAEQYPDPELLEYVRRRHRQILLEGYYKW